MLLIAAAPFLLSVFIARIGSRALARATLSRTVCNPSTHVNREAADPSQMAMNPAVDRFSALRAKAAAPGFQTGS
ncbi:hypothetical protein [Burkholderia anthina]|uniref:hypothetical protein n=1 Tax=Burkholderia anthina TaxID=179879 RepID=UPI001589313B|nr:hypothetical protein [Burkholderia anthina]